MAEAKGPWWLEKFEGRAAMRALAEDLREVALLWLVFAILDDFLRARALDFGWIAGNAAFALLVWSIGAYIEFKR